MTSTKKCQSEFCSSTSNLAACCMCCSLAICSSSLGIVNNPLCSTRSIQAGKTGYCVCFDCIVISSKKLALAKISFFLKQLPPMTRAMTLEILVLLAVLSTTLVGSFSPHSIPKYRHATALAARRTTDKSKSSSTTSTTSSSSMPRRNAKHRQRNSSVSEKQVAHHVANRYLHGSGGALRQASLRNNRNISKQDDNASFLKKLNRHPALLLNADYQPMSSLPLSLWNWQEAVKAVFSGKVTVVDVYDNVHVRAANLQVSLPSVIALNEYVPHFNQRPAFTKRNVFLRDEYRCQYCKNRFFTRDLSLDHVIPRCQGGLLTWENAVTCCNKCNCKKGSLTVQQLHRVGMKLSRKPFVPTQYQLAQIASRMVPQNVHPTWEPYLNVNGGNSIDSGEGEVDGGMFEEEEHETLYGYLDEV